MPVRLVAVYDYGRGLISRLENASFAAPSCSRRDYQQLATGLR